MSRKAHTTASAQHFYRVEFMQLLSRSLGNNDQTAYFELCANFHRSKHSSIIRQTFSAKKYAWLATFIQLYGIQTKLCNELVLEVTQGKHSLHEVLFLLHPLIPNVRWESLLPHCQSMESFRILWQIIPDHLRTAANLDNTVANFVYYTNAEFIDEFFVSTHKPKLTFRAAITENADILEHLLVKYPQFLEVSYLLSEFNRDQVFRRLNRFNLRSYHMFDAAWLQTFYQWSLQQGPANMDASLLFLRNFLIPHIKDIPVPAFFTTSGQWNQALVSYCKIIHA